MKALLVEELSDGALRTHASLVAEADIRITLNVTSGAAAVAALDAHDWWVEPLPLYEAATRAHARWICAFIAAQQGASELHGSHDDAFVSYGLEARLRRAVLGLAYLRRAVQDSAAAPEATDVYVVAADPYLSDAFRIVAKQHQFRSVTVHRTTAAGSLLNAARERVGASAAVRRVAVSRAHGGRRARSKQPPALAARPTAAVFVHSQHYLNLFRPVRETLVATGWDVRAVTYHPWPGSTAQSFADAVHLCEPRHQPPRPPQWALSRELLSGSPVSERWLRVALDASWLTGWQQFVLHRSVLERERPSIVVSYTIDAVGLGLQAAAQSLGIPSLFINHGPQGPVWSPWFFRWSATALAGQPCVEANAVSPFGEPNRGLVAVGHPPYDALIARAARARDQRRPLGVNRPASRPHSVLVFAEYGVDMWVHALQRRMLHMIAAALPGDCFLVCKLHPAAEEERAACERALRSALPHDAFAVVGERDGTTPDFLESCDVAVGAERCMALTDAIVMDRPSIGIRFPEIPPGSSNLDHPARGADFRACCRVVHDVPELRDALVSLTRRPPTLDQRRTHYLEQFYVSADGHATERVASLIRHVAAGHAPESFSNALSGAVPSLS